MKDKIHDYRYRICSTTSINKIKAALHDIEFDHDLTDADSDELGSLARSRIRMFEEQIIAIAMEQH